MELHLCFLLFIEFNLLGLLFVDEGMPLQIMIGELLPFFLLT